MTVSFVSAGTTAANTNTSLAPGTPASSLVGDVYVAFLGARTTTGAWTVPSGWTRATDFPHSNGANACKLDVMTIPVATNGQAVPTFIYSGGAANDTVLAHVACFRDVDNTSPIRQHGTFFDSINTQNCGAITGIAALAGNAVIVVGFKMDDWTGVALLGADGDAYVEGGDFSSTLGNDAGLVWDWMAPLSFDRTMAARTFTITGGGANFSTGVMLELAVTPPAATDPAEISAAQMMAGLEPQLVGYDLVAI